MASSRIEVATSSDRDVKIRGALRKRRRVVWGFRVFVAALLVSAIADNAFSLGDDWAKFDHREFTCASASDVDAILIQPQAVAVHLLGVASCTARFDALGAVHLGGYAGKSVVLKLEPTQTRDDQGRLLAWVFVEDGPLLDADVVRDGLALADRRETGALLTSVEQAEREARSRRRGLWNEVDSWEMPAWRREWTAQQREMREKLLRLASGE